MSQASRQPFDRSLPRDEFAGRRFLVTGGGSGIGRSTAELLASAGARVVVLDRDEASAHAAADACGGFSITADVSQESDVEAAVERAASELGGLDGLVNAAGASARARVIETSLTDWRRVLDVNLTGPFLVCRAALPFLRACAGATIVNVSSGTAMRPAAGRAAYSASKAGLIAFTRALAKEVAPAIRVNVVCPGPVDTPMFQRWQTGTVSIAATAENLAAKRIGEPEEIAHVIAFLSGAQSSFITGTMLMADGGGQHALS